MTEDILRRVRAEWAIREARQTLNLARVRCLPFEAMLARLRNLLADEQPSEVVYAVIEADRDDAQNQALATVLLDLTRTADAIDSKQKAWLERQVGRLIGALPPQYSRPLARGFLSDRRKGRRDIGFRCLNLTEIDEQLTRFLWNRFEETRDKRFLKSLLKQPLQMSEVDPSRLIQCFDDEDLDSDGKYWRMRVVEATLRTDPSTGAAFAATHPSAFVWACGRLGDVRFVPMIVECLRAANDKVELVGIVAWALGKLKAYHELEKMQPLLDELEQRNAMESVQA